MTSRPADRPCCDRHGGGAARQLPNAGLRRRAEAAGLTVPEYVKQVLADEGNDLRYRFLAAGAHFVDEFADAFEEQCGTPAADRGPATAA
ncbi:MULTISPECIES: hypothetical protein [unclassified Streptomyces]|uniref:hypothetical protein n=1 Tax=unclassified Streptomyces TaxID=2593676 RepID=UPI00344301FC